MVKARSSLLLAFVLVVAGCGSKGSKQSDAGRDTGTDAGVDVGTDAGVDLGRDAGADLGIDVGVDTGVDVGRDAGVDTGVDVGRDVGVDSGVDTGVDTGVDMGVDAGITNLRDRFPSTRPATITVSGRITKNDVACVIVGTAGGCLAQNSPPCSASGGQTTVSLDLTIDAQDNITVQAPYQDMCAPDYFCAISGPGCPIPTSYPVPLAGGRYLYDPRPTDKCRRDTSNTPIQVEHLVDVTATGAASLTIHQVCHTRMRNDGTTPSSYVNDTRDWTTVVTFP